jgi:hypothetical protein
MGGAAGAGTPMVNRVRESGYASPGPLQAISSGLV